MEANKILQSDILDLVFEGRNKDYGAYDLRRKYNRRITLALIITAALAAAAVLGTVLANTLKSGSDDDLTMRETTISNIVEEEKKPEPPPPPPKTPPPPKVETAKFTPPIIKKDEEVPQEEIPRNEDLDKPVIGKQNIEGIQSDELPPPPVDEKKEVIEVPKEDPNKIFEKVEIEASVDQKQWVRHLQSQLQRYIEDAANAGMDPGTYTVQVKFVVERDGAVTDVSAQNDPGFGLGKAAVDVLRKGPKWSPGIQNGKPVRSFHTQPITFVIQDQ